MQNFQIVDYDAFNVTDTLRATTDKQCLLDMETQKGAEKEQRHHFKQADRHRKEVLGMSHTEISGFIYESES